MLRCNDADSKSDGAMREQHHVASDCSSDSSSDEQYSDVAHAISSGDFDADGSSGHGRALALSSPTQQQQQLEAAAAAARSASGSSSATGRRAKSVFVARSSSSECSDSPHSANSMDRATSVAGVLELLHEELTLEMAPRKLLRQFSLTIPPSSASLGVCDTPEDYRSAILSRNAIPHASPNALGDVLARWERNHVKWRHRSSSSSGASTPQRERTGSATQQQQLDAADTSAQLATLLPDAIDAVYSNNNDTTDSDRHTGVLAGESTTMLEVERVPMLRHETYEVTFGPGFLGLEFVTDVARSEVVVKSVQPGNAWLANAVHVPPFATIARGHVVDAINSRDVSNGAVAPEDVLELLQFAQRPLAVRFRKSDHSNVVCKLCERPVDASALNEHTNYCIMSKRIELEADQINTTLTKLAASINANLHADTLRPYFHPEDLHFYNALRVVAIQASSCDVTSVESFALCSRLLKIVDRIRQQEPATASCAVERGAKYGARLRNLIHAKMSKMRATQKAMLQQAPSSDSVLNRAPFHRTKSLEEKDAVTTTGLAVRTSRLQTHQQMQTHQQSAQRQQRLSACRVSIHDFQIVKPISKGAYGKVYLARKKTTGDQYAIKVLAKEHLLRKKQQIENIETERDILVNVESPYVVKLFWTFQSRRNLFLVMEYLPGGDFMSLLECIVQLEEQVARVYIAEVALALNHLHSKGCVHRDLKPDNILISSTGHIKLTDFGLSEEAMHLSDSESETANDGIFGDLDDDVDDIDGVDTTVATIPDAVPERRLGDSHEQFGRDVNISALFDASRPQRRGSKQQQRRRQRRTQQRKQSHTYGRCGTPDYLSPEIILGIPHGPPVDYWALGIILYEMLVGFPPFNDDSVEAIFNNILERQILWPDGEKCLSPDAIDLISKLLEPDQALRLDWDGLQRHQFFDGVDWDTLLESIPPFVPTLEGPNDTSYFNNRNLTDIFIDDDDFDFDTKSVDSSASVVGSQDAAGGDNDGDVVGTSGNPAELGSPDTESNSGGGQAPAVTTTYLDNMASDAVGIAARGDATANNCRFPSGMYGSPDDVNLTEAFRSFSFTNMNALAAASRTEAELLTDSRLLDVENASALSILI